jgi:hypothetical protein
MIQAMRAALLFVLLVTSAAAAQQAQQQRPLPDFNDFAARVKARLATDDERQSGYTFREKRVEQRLDGKGRVTSESVKLYEVYPGLPGEERYRRLLEEDGKAVPAERLTKQDRERQKEAEECARKLADRGTREKAERQQAKERARYSAAVDDIFRIYDIRMLRREPLDGHDTILATLTPRRDTKPRTDDGKIMRHFSARAWVNEADGELVRVEITAIDTLTIGLGLLARIDKGTVASYQRRWVNSEAWLPAQVTWTAGARVLLLKRLRVRGIAEFSDYRKFTVDTDTTIATPH